MRERDDVGKSELMGKGRGRQGKGMDEGEWGCLATGY